MLGAHPFQPEEAPVNAPALTDVREAHRFDEAALRAYMDQHMDGLGGQLHVQQFEGGQSNPTFLLSIGDRKLVMRKKPPGVLLPSAHMVEREYRIYSALQGTGVPVPRTHFLCEDPAVIGTPFYVMDFVQGRVFREVTLPELSPDQRRSVYDDMARALASLHGVDVQAHGLADYGKPGNYFERQIGRWTKQYRSAETDTIPSMEGLLEWLPAHMPKDDTTTIVHGDYQLYNLMYHPDEPRVVAILDWELSTLGHPMADLAYNCMKYHQPLADGTPADKAYGGATGIPSEEQFIARYCEFSGRSRIDGWNFYLAFSYFRLASIIQGVYKRGLQGNASSQAALSMKDVVAMTSDVGWKLAQGL
jgi:aminoglycoside phosphotransferase (APT) family kinase protein